MAFLCILIDWHFEMNKEIFKILQLFPVPNWLFLRKIPTNPGFISYPANNPLNYTKKNIMGDPEYRSIVTAPEMS